MKSVLSADNFEITNSSTLETEDGLHVVIIHAPDSYTTDYHTVFPGQNLLIDISIFAKKQLPETYGKCQ